LTILRPNVTITYYDHFQNDELKIYYYKIFSMIPPQQPPVNPSSTTSTHSPQAAKVRNLGEVLQEFGRQCRVMQDELHKVIVGQSEVVQQIFAAIFTRGHCLLEGVPGLAKTLMVGTIAQILDVEFKRIQFTPDLMPSDITGTTILDEDAFGKRNFRFVKGPLFTNILLADEINRTPPKTQSALLQAMQEREVTAGQTTYPLPEPFFTIATQNPIEQEGTYPLPEAQLDRFMFNIKVDYPTLIEEERILTITTRGEKAEIRKIMSGKVIANLQKLVQSIAVSQYVVQYTAKLVRATRPNDEYSPKIVKELVDWGAGPRAGQFLINGAKAIAAMDGRFSVAIDDVKAIAIPVLRHRICTNFQAQAEGISNENLIQTLVKTVSPPKIEKETKKN
jgi:MoxR-like ATPase